MTPPRTRWRRVNLGLYLVGIGVLLLLTSLDRLSWTYWLEAAAFWPVILVALGIRVLFERSRTPALVLLAPAVVLGTLGYVAVRPPRPWRGQWIPLRAEGPAGPDGWTFVMKLARAELDLTSSDLEGELLVDGRAGSERGLVQLRTRGDRERHRVEARTERRFWPGPPSRQRWELRLARRHLVDVDLNLAFGQGRVDLTGATLRRLDVDGAFNDLVVRLDAPRESVRLDVSGAFNRVRLLVPPATPVTVRSRGALLFVEGRDDEPASFAAGYTVSLEGFMSSLDVESPPGPPPGSP